MALNGLRACSFCTYSGLGIQTEVRIRVPFGKTGIEIVFRFWFINQTRAGLPWFMLVYRRREPDNSSKYKYKQVGRDLFFFFFFFFMLAHRRFRFFPCLREQPGKQSFARSPSSKYRLTCVGKHNKLFLVLFRIFLTAFPSTPKRTAVNTAAALHFLPVTMNTRSKTDEKERRR